MFNSVWQKPIIILFCFCFKELHKVIYVEDNIQYLKDISATNEKPEPKDSKSGIRVLKVHNDGLQLASGDRMGNIRYMSTLYHPFLNAD